MLLVVHFMLNVEMNETVNTKPALMRDFKDDLSIMTT